MNKPHPYPDWLDKVWAKSAAREGEAGESLALHTWNVLSRFADLVKMRPTLPAQLGVPRLWHSLFWACWLHDLGKSASGFQAMLCGGDPWQRRHEVLSLAFVPWLSFEKEDRLWIAAAVASHHKDPGEIEGYTRDMAALETMVADVPPANLKGIWRWMDECREGWLRSIELPPNLVELPALLPLEEALRRFAVSGASDIQAALQDYLDWADPFVRGYSHAANTPPILLRGITIQSDHTASAHTRGLEPVHVAADELLAEWEKQAKRQFNMHAHQRAAMAQEGSALLVAPTGSGKTEAALLWASRQAGERGKLPRLFYTLPYQASMNAMEERLKKSFSDDKVGLQHGRSLLALYRRMMDRGYTTQEAARSAKWANNLARLNYHPVRVFSPYQMLKAFYRLKGYEPILADYYGAAFIFDEIHAYEPNRLALILKSVQHLREYYRARFFFMTATFPSMIKSNLREALGQEVRELVADETVFTEFRRHRLHLLDGDLLDPGSLDVIVEVAGAGKSVLVCCNTVSRAQEVYSYLQARPQLVDVKKVLLHSRYNGRDRLAREKEVQRATGSKSDARQPIVLVATQVVEVSLDIDLDTIYSDPAPLEALLQRFGRVNRRRLIEDLTPVHVYRQPDDGQHIYDPDHVQGALRVLERIDGQPVDEAAVGTWLDEIYVGDVATKWEDEYAGSAAHFDRAWVQELRGFATADDEVEDEFNELFDGIEVLPAAFKDEYRARVEAEGDVAVSELLVPISYAQFARLNRAGKIEARTSELTTVVTTKYDEEGLHLNE